MKADGSVFSCNSGGLFDVDSSLLHEPPFLSDNSGDPDDHQVTSTDLEPRRTLVGVCFLQRGTWARSPKAS